MVFAPSVADVPRMDGPRRWHITRVREPRLSPHDRLGGGCGRREMGPATLASMNTPVRAPAGPPGPARLGLERRLAQRCAVALARSARLGAGSARQVAPPGLPCTWIRATGDRSYREPHGRRAGHPRAGAPDRPPERPPRAPRPAAPDGEHA